MKITMNRILLVIVVIGFILIYVVHGTSAYQNYSVTGGVILNQSEWDGLNNTFFGYSGNFPNSTVATNSGTWTAKEPAITGTVLTDYFTGTKIFRPLNTSIVPEVTNLYYTDVRAKAAITGTSPITVTNGLVAISTANITTTGALTSTDWNTFNGKGAGTVTAVTATKPLSSSGGTAPNLSITRQVPFFNSSTFSCSHTGAATNLMAGFGATAKYTTSANTTGTIHVTLDYSKTAPATVSLTSSDKIVWGTGTPPACNAVASGTVVGNTYVSYNPSALANRWTIEETVAISGLSASTAYWIDIQSLSSTTAVWINSLPQLTVIEP